MISHFQKRGWITILFQDLQLSDAVRRAVDDLHYREATKIQAEAIPAMLSGRDIIGRSSTGTGKTAAFGIPAIEHTDPSVKRPQTLVVCPTRELAMQNCDAMRKLAKYKENIKFALLYGGQPMGGQIAQLRNANIVIGTPGRMMDHIRRRTLKLGQVKLVVLDEADEMLDMGFLDDIRTILKAVPENRQTALFSATMPPEILKITKEVQKNPKLIAVDGGRRTVDTIAQYFYRVPQGRKKESLCLLLDELKPQKTIVFCNTRRMVDALDTYLRAHGYRSAALHGDMEQKDRTRVMNGFKNGRTSLLVATDVAARGIDVKNIDAVFNFDIGQDFEYYIHRIGRTGRAKKSGTAYTLVENNEQLALLRELEQYVKCPIKEQQLPKNEAFAKLEQQQLRDLLTNNISVEADDAWLELVEEFADEGYDIKRICCAVLQMYMNKGSVPKSAEERTVQRAAKRRGGHGGGKRRR